jgi:hypothetical protein
MTPDRLRLDVAERHRIGDPNEVQSNVGCNGEQIGQYDENS